MHNGLHWKGARDLANGLAIFVAAVLQGVCALASQVMQATLTSIRRPFLLIKGNHHVFLSYLQATPDYEDVAALLR